jgi:hypothetical protein
MIVTIAKVADFDQFLKTFSTKGAEKRKEHGSKGSQVFRDPMTPAGCGWPSSGRLRTTRSSSPIRRSRQSSRNSDSKGRP